MIKNIITHTVAGIVGAVIYVKREIIKETFSGCLAKGKSLVSKKSK